MPEEKKNKIDLIFEALDIDGERQPFQDAVYQFLESGDYENAFRLVQICHTNKIVGYLEEIEITLGKFLDADGYLWTKTRRQE